MLLCAPLAGRLLPPGRWAKSSGPKRAWARERSGCCLAQAVPAWNGHWVSVSLSLMMASCVLWTSQQDVELSLLETELGPKAT